MSPIRVLYNVPDFGMFQMTGGTRHGIGRVVEEVARQLQVSPDCELRLMASDFQGLAGLWLKNQFPEATFVHTPLQQTISRLLTIPYDPKLMFDTTQSHRASVRAKRFVVKGVMAPFRPWLRRVPAASLHDMDVFHAAGGIVPSQLVQSRIPVFVTLYDLIPVLHPEFFVNLKPEDGERILAGLSKDRWYVCISEHTKQDLLATGRCDPDKVSVAPLAASKEFAPNHNFELAAECRRKYGVGDSPFLLSVCTLEPRKNLDFVVRGFLRLIKQQNLPDLKLLLVGGAGWKYQHISEPLKNAGISARQVLFAGFVPDIHLPALYSEALAFVYMSHYEGFGLPPLEAMQCGSPVITSNTSSLPEVVGNAGLMVKPTDLDGFCNAVWNVVNMRELRDRMSRRSVQQASKFSWERCARMTVEAYRKALPPM